MPVLGRSNCRYKYGNVGECNRGRGENALRKILAAAVCLLFFFHFGIFAIAIAFYQRFYRRADRDADRIQGGATGFAGGSSGMLAYIR